MSTSPSSSPTAAADKEKLLALLRESRRRFVGSFAGITDEQSRFHPAEGQWSILDTVEHLTTAEQAMVKLVTETRCPRAAATPNREEIFLRVVADRSRKMQSP